MLKHKLVDFIIQFMEEVDKEISEMKLFVCTLIFLRDSIETSHHPPSLRHVEQANVDRS